MAVKGITAIVPTYGMGSNPASVNRKTGICYINAERWNSYKPEHRLFILLHEYGHAFLQSTNELEVDKWAFNQYATLGYPLSESIFALSKQLNYASPEHEKRVEQLDSLARDYDYHINGNQQAKKKMNFNSNYYGHADNPYYDDAFLGMCFGSKRCQKRRKARQEARVEKRKLKNEERRIANQADKNAIGGMGENLSTGITDLLKGILGGQGSAPRVGSSSGGAYEEPAKKDKTGMYVGIGIAAVVVIVLVLVFAKGGRR